MAPGCAPGVEERRLLGPALQRLEALLRRIRLLRVAGAWLAGDASDQQQQQRQGARGRPRCRAVERHQVVGAWWEGDANIGVGWRCWLEIG
jgi:hypothetical protein